MIELIRCYLFGHDWIVLPYEDGPNGWFYENYKCSHCKKHRRELVASKLG